MARLKKTKNQRIAELERKLKESLASQIHTYYFACDELDKFSTDKMMGSGVVLELSSLGGDLTVSPVVIVNGLSDETISALKADLVRSYNSKIEFKPKGP